MLVDLRNHINQMINDGKTLEDIKLFLHIQHQNMTKYIMTILK